MPLPSATAAWKPPGDKPNNGLANLTRPIASTLKAAHQRTTRRTAGTEAATVTIPTTAQICRFTA
jgi:hypothetical protein